LRIRSISIHGYGRFNGEEIHFAPGLQVVAGPNERGKSTIRSFIADMLYGQKVNDTQRVFEESNELRKPWNGDGTYGGALIYELDDGRTVRVVRNFDRQGEKIEVFDGGSGDEITGTFERSRNRELDFARQHLGLSKEVFLHAATISHLTLDELGDREALDEIREKLLALTDTGGGSGTVECAMRLLSERVAAIGMSGAANKPLAQSRQKLRALEAEYRETLARREALAALALERKALVERCQKLRGERQAAEAALKTLESHEERDRLDRALALQEAIDEATRQCLALSHAREVAPERDTEIQALYDGVRTAARQLETARAKKAHLDDRLHTESGGGGTALAPMAAPFPAALEQRLNESVAARAGLAARIGETEALLQAATDRIEQVRDQLAALPDFSRLAADPVEWLSQLASSFSVALRARDEECAERDALRKEVDALVEKNADRRALFAGHDDFPELAREYALQLRLFDSQKDQHNSTLHTLQGTYAELQGESRAFLPLGCACLGIAVLTGSLQYIADFGDTRIIAWVATFVGIVFLAMWGTQRGHMRRLRERIEDAREAVNSVSKAAGNPSLEVIDVMLKRARLGSIRELEAMHDQYRTIEMELKLRGEALAVQEEKAQEAEERIPLFLERFRETFAKAGEEINSEDDVQEASGRAIARYQEYRETKRRAATNRSVLERHEAELARLQALAAEADADRSSLEAEARAFIAENGLGCATGEMGVQEAIEAYREAFVRNREVLGRQDILGEDLRDLERQLDGDTRALAQCEAALAQALRPFGVADMDGWNRLMEDVQAYQRIALERRTLEDDLADTLGHDTLPALQARVAAAGEPGERPQATWEALRESIDALNEALEAETEQEHRLHLRLTEQSTGVRSRNQIEEEQAALLRKVRALEAEGDATSYAMALMEDVARDTHAYVAPRLAEAASGLLAQITNGTYNEISLGRDLSVRVRIPETQRLQESPEKSLSQGTVDQIYLALRLAFVQSLNANGEGIPMLLDDPFANYDDTRLATTMGLIARLVGQNQVILFTCRDDVVEAAERHSASIIRL